MKHLKPFNELNSSTLRRASDKWSRFGKENKRNNAINWINDRNFNKYKFSFGLIYPKDKFRGFNEEKGKFSNFNYEIKNENSEIYLYLKFEFGFIGLTVLKIKLSENMSTKIGFVEISSNLNDYEGKHKNCKLTLFSNRRDAMKFIGILKSDLRNFIIEYKDNDEKFENILYEEILDKLPEVDLEDVKDIFKRLANINPNTLYIDINSNLTQTDLMNTVIPEFNSLNRNERPYQSDSKEVEDKPKSNITTTSPIKFKYT